jgi:V/A-type H+-transporting ATPase subunit B
MSLVMQQLVRHTRVQDIVGDVIRVQATGVALGDMAEVENTDGESSLARAIGLDRDIVSLQVFGGGKGLSTDATVQFLGCPLDVV